MSENGLLDMDFNTVKEDEELQDFLFGSIVYVNPPSDANVGPGPTKQLNFFHTSFKPLLLALANLESSPMKFVSISHS